MRKIIGHIKKMPWPEPSGETLANPAQPWEMHVNLPVADGERVLLLTCLRNPNYTRHSWSCYEKPADFRLLVSKKHRDYRVIDRAGKASAGSGRVWGGRDTGSEILGLGIRPEEEGRIRRFLGADANRRTRNHQIDNLWAYAARLREEKREEGKRSRGEIMGEEADGCPEELPEGFVEYIKKEILDQDNTILYKKGGKKGLCHRCRAYVKLEPGWKRFRNYEYIKCPNCRNDCIAILAGGAAWLADNVCETAAFQKGAGGTLFIRIFRVRRDQEARYRDLRGYLWEFERYAIRGKHTRRWTRERRQRTGWGSLSTVERIPLPYWEENNQGYVNIDKVFSGNMPEVLAGTSLQYACMKDYITRRRHNPTYYAVCAARYPVMEFLYKRGYTKLIDQRVSSIQKQYAGTIRWSGESLKDCFRFPIRWLKTLPAKEWEMEMIERCNQLYEKNPSAGDGEILIRAKYDTNPLLEYAPYAGIEKMVSYLVKQCREEKKPKRAYEADPVLAGIRTYRDYLQECVELKLNLKDKNVLFPPSLERAHQRTMSQVAYERNKEEAEAFEAQVEKLAPLSWSDKKRRLSIRPAASHEELKKEGAALHHCVAGYASRMARGATAIFLIRRLEEPDSPYYTLELQGKRVVQCRTLNNRSYTQDPETEAFVNEWLKRKVDKTDNPPKKSKTGTAA